MKRFNWVVFPILMSMLAIAADTRISTDQLILGRKQSGNVDKTIQFEIGSGASANPKLKWDHLGGSFAFANDGQTFRQFGSGSGSGGGGINLLASNNGDFESGTANWTASGSAGDLTVVTTSPNLIDGQKTGAWTPGAANRTLSTTLQSLTSVAGLQGANCAATALYKTAEATNLYQWEVLDNSSNILAGPVTLPQTTNLGTGAQKAPALTFPCPSSGSIQVKFIAASSTPASPLYVDDVTLGTNTLLNLSQAQFVGGALTPFSSGSGCRWNRDSTSWGNYGVQASCATPTVDGSAAAPTTKIPGIRFPNGLAAGTYYVVAYGAFTQASDNQICSWRFSDGTNNFGFSNQRTSTGRPIYASELSGHVTYTAPQGDTTIQMQVINNTAGDCSIDASDMNNNSPFNMEVYYFPPQPSMAFKPDQIGWRVDASIGGSNVSLGTSSVTNVVTPGDAALVMTSNNSSASVQIPCSSTNPSTGLTCAAGNPQIGVVFNAPTAGPVRACFTYGLNIATGGGGSTENIFTIAETANNNDATIIQYGKTHLEASNLSANINNILPITLCEDFLFPNAGQHTLRLFYSSSTGGTVPTNQIIGDGSGPGSNRNIRVTVLPIGSGINHPLLVNSVVTPQQGVMALANAGISNNGSTASIASQTGNWIASTTRVGTGQINVVLNSYFSNSNNLVCFCNDLSTARYCKVHVTDVTHLVINNYDGSGTAVDDDQTIMCMGPR